ncbi:MAG: hypothetical protein MUE97_04915, partial [Phycisphaerales bacterium]|nr:hypothetical protein [Phycisphaerales bacterium]
MPTKVAKPAVKSSVLNGAAKAGAKSPAKHSAKVAPKPAKSLASKKSAGKVKAVAKAKAGSGAPSKGSARANGGGGGVKHSTFGVFKTTHEFLSAEKPIVYVNGMMMPKGQAMVSVYDHGLLYGDGVFEGIRIYNGKIFKCGQ